MIPEIISILGLVSGLLTILGVDKKKPWSIFVWIARVAEKIFKK